MSQAPQRERSAQRLGVRAFLDVMRYPAALFTSASTAPTYFVNVSARTASTEPDRYAQSLRSISADCKLFRLFSAQSL